jgi:Flp pilus assembly protein TadD
MQLHVTRRVKLLFAACLMSFCALAQSPDFKLSNEQIAGMLKAGMNEDAVVKMISGAASAGRTRFDVSDKGLAVLRQAGASARVIQAITAASTGNRSTPGAQSGVRPTAPASAPTADAMGFVLSNTQITAMLQTGVSEDSVINTIYQSAAGHATSFDLSDNGVAALRRSGVSARVLQAMMASADPNRNAAVSLPNLRARLKNPGQSSQELPPVPSAAEIVTHLVKVKKLLEEKAGAQKVAALQKAIAHPASANDLDNYGVVLWIQKAPLDSALALVAAAQKASTDFLPLSNLGAVLTQIGLQDVALPLLLRARALSPANPMVSSNLGMVLIRASRLTLAKRLLEEAVKTDPENNEAQHALGVLAQAEGDNQSAEQYFNNSLNAARTTRAESAYHRLVPRPRDPPPKPPVPGSLTESVKSARLLELPNSVGEYPGFVRGKQGVLGPLYKAVDAEQKRVAARGKELGQRSQQFMQGLAAARGSGFATPLSSLGAVRAFDQVAQYFGWRTRTLQAKWLKLHTDLDPAINQAWEQIKAQDDREHNSCEAVFRAGGDANSCIVERDRRRCARHNSAMQPFYAQKKEAYENFASDYLSATKMHVQGAYYWAGRLAGPFTALKPLQVKVNAMNAYYYVSGEAFGVFNQLSNLCESDEAFAMPSADFDVSEFLPRCTEEAKEQSHVKVLLLVGSIEFDCEKLKIEGGEGLVGYAEFNLAERTTTIFIGGGAEIEVGAEVGAAKVGVAGGGKMGFYVTLGENGGVEDAGLREAVELKSMLGLDKSIGTEATKEIGMRMGINSGIDVGPGVE